MDNRSHPQLMELERVAYDAAAAMAHTSKPGWLLVFYGQNGTGKTHAARALCRWFNAVAMSLDPVQVRVESVPRLEIAHAKFVNWPEVVDGFKRGQWEIVDDLISEYLVALDDVGAEHDTTKFSVEKLYQILNRRERKWTIITTNFGPESLEERFERRIASRMLRNSMFVDLSNVPDFNS